MDTGVQFAKWGFRTFILLGERCPAEAQVTVVTTDSRAEPAPVAVAKVRQAVAPMQGWLLYKKIDSTLRGNVGWEVVAAMDQLGLKRAVVCPAFPAAGRTVVDGRLLVRGVPVSQTELGQDPLMPVAESHLPTILRRQTAKTVVYIGLRAVEHAEPQTLAEALRDGPEGVWVFDAVTEAHLEAIARAVLVQWEGCLPVGSAGLGGQLARCLAQINGLYGLTNSNRPPGGFVLVVAGSRQETTQRQIQALQQALTLPLVPLAVAEVISARHSTDWLTPLVEKISRWRAEGEPAVIIAPAGDYQVGGDRRVAQALAMVVERVVTQEPLGGLCLTGGDIARETCRLLGAEGLWIRGELEPGVASGQLAGGSSADLWVVTKAGGFGSSDCFVKAVKFLKGA